MPLAYKQKTIEEEQSQTKYVLESRLKSLENIVKM